jgi:hypothetical protein
MALLEAPPGKYEMSSKSFFNYWWMKHNAILDSLHLIWLSLVSNDSPTSSLIPIHVKHRHFRCNWTFYWLGQLIKETNDGWSQLQLTPLRT